MPGSMSVETNTWSKHISKTIDMKTKYCGDFKVYIQGTQERGKVAFLTVHDVGSNHVPFIDFVSSGPMEEVAKHSVWFHVCLPGQDDRDPEFAEHSIYPTLDAIAHDLLEILELSNLKAVIAFGEGAGANILLRFGLMYSNRCFGLVLINCTGSGAGVDERLSSTFSHFMENGKKFIEKFRGIVHHTGELPVPKTSTCNENSINLKNVEKYAEAYGKRTDINKFLPTDLNTDCLVITGRMSPFKPLCEELLTHMNKVRTTLLVVDDAVDVLYQHQKDTVQSLILFSKGCGVLLGVPMLGLEKEFRIVKSQNKTSTEHPTAAQKELGRQVQLFEAVMKQEVELKA